MKENILSRNQAFDLKSRYQAVLKSIFTVFLMLCSLGVWGQKTYKLITSTTDLVAGEKYILGNSQTTSTQLLGYQNNNNRPQSAGGASIINSNNIIVTPATTSGDTSKPYELTLGGGSGAWTLTDAATGINLQATSSSNNYLKSGSGTWTITFSSGAAVITCTNGGDNKIIRFNTNLFSCYSGGQSAVYLYKEVASGKTSNCAVCSWNDGNAWLPTGVPLASDVVTIRPSDIIYNTNANLLRSAATNVNGSFQIQEGSSVDTSSQAFNYGTIGTLIFNNSSPFYAVNNNDKYWPYTSGPVNVKVLQGGFNLNSGVTRIISGNLETASGISIAPGENLTINGTTTINTNGFFSFKPTFGPASKLIYNTGGVYNRGLEWSTNVVEPGYPNNVQISGNTTIDFPSTGGGAFNQNLGIDKNLTIDAGSSLFMGYGDNGNKSGSLTIGGNLLNNGNFGLGNAIGGDFSLKGNWTNGNTASFYANSRSVNFIGTVAQTVTGTPTFDYLTLNNSNGLALSGPTSSVIVNQNFTLSNGKLTLGSNDLKMGSPGTITGSGNAKFIVTDGVGQLRRTVSMGNVLFPIGPSATNYNPITVSNSGASDVYGFRVVQGVSDAPDINKMVNNSWFVSEVVAGGGNLRVMPQWNTADEGSDFSAVLNDNFIELYSPSIISYPATVNTQTASLTNSGDNFSNSLTGTTYFAVAIHSAPLITSSLTANAYQSVPFSYQIVATNSPTSYNATSLPTGFTINTSTGEISGTTAVATGNYNVTITATNGRGVDTKTLVITVGSGPCLNQVNFTSKPTGWAETNITYSSNEALFASISGQLTTLALANPATLTFDLRRSTNSNEKTLYVEVSTTTQTGSYTVVDTYDHANTISGNTTSITVDLSAYTSFSTVFVRFRKESSTTSPWYLKNVKVFCGTSTPTVSQPTDHFRSKQIGNWTAVSSWQSSSNGSTGWIDADLAPTSSASSIAIRNGHQVTINTGGVSMTNTTVENGGILEVTTTSSFDLSGNGSGRNIQLTIKNNGHFLVNSPSNFSSPTGNASGLVEAGGKLIAGPNMGIASTGNTGSAFSDAYLGKNNGIFYFGDTAICEWACPNTTLGSAAPTDTDFFFPDNPTDMPIFRVTTSPAFEFGSPSTNNVFNSILEVISPAVFQIGKGNSSGSTGTKRFIGGVRGSGIVTQNASPTGNIFLGDGTHVPFIDGSITLNIQDNRLKLPNGVNVPPSANVTIKSGAINSSFDRQGGNITIDGILDITNMRITNTATGGISVNNGGTLKTAHTGGLYGTGAAIANGAFTINTNSTINYYADVNQKISTTKDYYNIIFSGSGGVKSPSTANPVNVDQAGKVTITGNPTVNFSSNNLASITANTTDFEMDGGRLILGTAQLLPNMRGPYNITGGTIEFTANAFGIRTPNTYHNIEITVPATKEVTYAGGNLTLNNGASVLVKSNATLTSTSGNASLVGTTGNMLTVESSATFKTAVTSGFYGPSGLPNFSPSVRDNITLDLKPGSTVEYARLSGEYGLPNNALSGDQTITPLLAGYQKLQIVGDGIKTAKGEITVNEMTNLSSTSATLVVPGYDILTNPVYSVFYALGGISNTNGTSGNFILGNDAQLMQNAIAVNTAAKIEANRNLILTEARKEYNYLISPLEGQDMKSVIGEDAGNIQFVTKINEATSMFVNAGVGPYVKGLAYAVKETVPSYNDPGFDVAKFKGKPFNEDLDFQLYKTAENRGYNLSGNPYPSNLDLDALYTASSNIESTFRFWDNKANNIYVQQGGSYQGYSYAFYNAPNGTGVAAPGGNGMSATGIAPNHILKVGQGFMIRVSPGVVPIPLPGTAATLSFKNSQRIVDQTDAQFFGRNAKSTTKDRYWLEYVTPSNLVISNAVVYFAGGTNLFSADDTRFPGSSDALYSMADETKVIINGRSPFDLSDRIPLGTKAFTAGSYKIRLGKKEGIFDNSQTIYLKDKQLGVITDISQGAYNFTSESGEFTNRFEIVYEQGIVLSTGTSNLSKVEVFREAADFVVRSTAEKIDNVEIYDAAGRLVLTLAGRSKEVRFNSETLVEGMYILKISTEDGEQVTKKIRK